MPAAAPAPARARSLSDDQLTELLTLLDGSDSVEMKLTVPDTAIRSTGIALDMDPLDAEIRIVTFFDTPDLALYKAGVVVRARRIQGAMGDSVVKLRPVVPDTLSPQVRALEGFGVEIDAMPGGFVCSGRLKAPRDNAQIRAALHGERPIRKLFTKEQRALYRAHAPEGIELDDLTVLGPIIILKLKFVPPGLPRKMVAELWTYPDGSRIFELSTKSKPHKAFDAADQVRAYMEERGIDLSGEQAAKTRKALLYFSRLVAKDA